MPYALGRAYPMNIKNGVNLDIPTLEKSGYNNSMVHSDLCLEAAIWKLQV